MDDFSPSDRPEQPEPNVQHSAAVHMDDLPHRFGFDLSNKHKDEAQLDWEEDCQDREFAETLEQMPNTLDLENAVRRQFRKASWIKGWMLMLLAGEGETSDA